MKNLVVMASGGGSNFQVLVEACARGALDGRVALLIHSRPDAGVVGRAAALRIPAKCVPFGSPHHGQQLLDACSAVKPDLICLAGWVHKLPDDVVQTYRQRILNVHPSLLPAFGGQGMYGRRVHDAVLASGAKWTGCTVHWVDEELDHGAIIMQQPVPVLPDDTVESLSARVLAVEHALYPKAVAAACQGRLGVDGRRVWVKPAVAPGLPRRALISVSDKTGIVEFARELSLLGVELVSTGGTARVLLAAGLPVRHVESLTSFPEMLGGRVKTLHPMIHGGILYRRDHDDHAHQVAALGIEDIDMVVVNLYPFAEAAKKHPPWHDELIEEIDIGGPSLLRAAAKNHRDVLVVTDPGDYARVVQMLKAGQVPLVARRELAQRAFERTALYDATIAEKLAGPDERLPRTWVRPLHQVQKLRYGENPHQDAALYRSVLAPDSFAQLHGKELSYNNLLDAEGAWDAVGEFDEPAAVIFKHVTPCGVAVSPTLDGAFRQALACDPVCAFGGILAVNRELDEATAHAIGDLFLEVIVAPAFSESALLVLRKKKNLRLLEGKQRSSVAFRSVGEGVLVQHADRALWAEGGLTVVTNRHPSEDEMRALRFAWAVCKHVRSNAIVLGVEQRSVGLGAGQMSRVDAVRVAHMKLEQYLAHNSLGDLPLVAASDAFFPFRDGVDELQKAGVTAVIQPGGSVRDDEVVAAANELGMAMVFTGMRHFRH